MPVNRYFSSNAIPTTLAGNIGAGSSPIGVNSPTGYPGTFPFTIAVDYGTATEELMDVTAATGGTWTVTRGVDGTSAQSHAVGAPVQHVTSARDFADYQNHQAATAAVHGVTGSVVGTSDSQTLTNKTLTSPTVNAGALSGTFTGAPTLSGNVVFSGAPNFTGTPTLGNGAALSGTLSGSPTFSGSPVFSGTPNFTGTLMATGASVLVERTLVTDSAYRSRIAGDANSRFLTNARGDLGWGPGTTAVDTNLYRPSANTLQTDDTFVSAALQVAGDASIGGNISAANMNLGAWGSWTPAWTTVTGAHLPAYGNANVAGSYVKIGRSLFFSLGITFGSGTTFGSGVVLADNWLFSLPAGLTASAAFAGKQTLCGMGRASGPTVAPVSVRVEAGATSFFLDTAGGGQDGNALGNTGSLDSLTPWTWTSGHVIQFSGMVETTT